ncbi:MAG: ribonucleotide reductase N-terminal alpha domain-containing protein, partial [Candidatus Marinimicrobia bacterium]|nr:ribonucleotide reductase N-terminal alpha domain-containing protein [Candidatus Neomarinimicrobiota bacterium]
MAEAMEFDFSLPSNEGKKFDPELVEKVKRIQEEANGKASAKDIPENFTIESYYTDDDLGADVLKNKYLAPWENHPMQIWQRQAKALASIEKNKKLQKKWEKKFFTVLEDFKFVPGGRIMHGAGREDITTTLNNCYVVAIKD